MYIQYVRFNSAVQRPIIPVPRPSRRVERKSIEKTIIYYMYIVYIVEYNVVILFEGKTFDKKKKVEPTCARYTYLYDGVYVV